MKAEETELFLRLSCIICKCIDFSEGRRALEIYGTDWKT